MDCASHELAVVLGVAIPWCICDCSILCRDIGAVIYAYSPIFMFTCTPLIRL